MEGSFFALSSLARWQMLTKLLSLVAHKMTIVLKLQSLREVPGHVGPGSCNPGAADPRLLAQGRPGSWRLPLGWPRSKRQQWAPRACGGGLPGGSRNSILEDCLYLLISTRELF